MIGEPKTNKQTCDTADLLLLLQRKTRMTILQGCGDSILPEDVGGQKTQEVSEGAIVI